MPPPTTTTRRFFIKRQSRQPPGRNSPPKYTWFRIKLWHFVDLSSVIVGSLPPERENRCGFDWFCRKPIRSTWLLRIESTIVFERICSLLVFDQRLCGSIVTASKTFRVSKSENEIAAESISPLSRKGNQRSALAAFYSDCS